MANIKPHRRRVIVADREAQVRVVLWFLLHLLVYSVVTLAMILMPSILRLTTADFPLEEQLEASREFMFVDGRVVPVLLVMAAAAVFHFLIITHRIFGPLVRLKGTLVRWREQGLWPREMHVRKRDFHEPLFEEFNRSVSPLGEDLSLARGLLRRVAEEAPSPALAAECRLALERLDRWQR